MQNVNEQMKKEQNNSSDTFSPSQKSAPKDIDKGDYIDFEEIK